MHWPKNDAETQIRRFFEEETNFFTPSSTDPTNIQKAISSECIGMFKDDQNKSAKRFKCEGHQCSSSFTNEKEFNKHFADMHGKLIKAFVCKEPGCAESFEKMSALSLHSMSKHTISKDEQVNLEPLDFEYQKYIELAQLRNSSEDFFLSCPTQDEADIQLKKFMEQQSSPIEDLDEGDLGEQIEEEWVPVHQELLLVSTYFILPSTSHIRMNAAPASSVIPIKRAKENSSKRFKCEAERCDRSFSTNKEYENHFARMHIRKKTFMCEEPECDKKYSTKDSLNLHMTRDHSLKRFACKICKVTFSLRGDCRQHIKRRHNSDSDKLIIAL